MESAVYNLAIQHSIHLQKVYRALRPARGIGVLLRTCCLILGLTIAAWSADWSGPEQQLARKIVAVTGPGAVAWSVDNRSSLGKRESEIVSNGLRAALEAA